MDKIIYYNELYNLYGSFLTDHEKEIFHDYYEDNLSLAEIAENYNISRNAIHKTIKTVEEKLTNFETQLNLLSKKDTLGQLLFDQDINQIKERIKTLLERW